MVFPQLSTGAVVQYPVQTSRLFRTIVNETEDGRLIRFHDAAAQRVSWNCKYADLSRPEWDALRSLHEAVEGRLKTFLFLDPFDNLLRWSERFEDPTWIRSPYLTAAPGASDPKGGTNGYLLSSTSEVSQAISQHLPIPGGYVTSFSTWLRNSSPSGVSLIRTCGSWTDVQSVYVGSEWTRVCSAGRSAIGGSQTEFAIALDGGASVEIYGAQIDAQPEASAYKRTSGDAGVYPNARFANDELKCIVTAPGRFQVDIKIQAALGG